MRTWPDLIRELVDGVGEARQQNRAVGAEDHPAGVGADQVGHGATGVALQLGSLHGRRERAAGYRPRDVFPHRVFHLPKAAPDGFKVAARTGLKPTPSSLWELVLFALPPALDEFPRELFFDDDIVWHRQHYGLPGQVAVASVVASDVAHISFER